MKKCFRSTCTIKLESVGWMLSILPARGGTLSATFVTAEHEENMAVSTGT